MARSRKLGGNYQVTVDLSKLTLTDLEWLSSGVHSALEARRREDDSGRLWNIPKVAVEVRIED